MAEDLHFPLSTIIDARATSPKPHIVNGTYLLPAKNGTYIDPYYCTNQICPLSYGEIRYLPSFAGNLVYLCLFAVFLFAQTGQGIYYRTWGFLVGTFCGLILEIVGYAGRLLLHANDFNFNYFIIYIVCLTIGPAFITASIYLCLSRLVVACRPSVSRFSPKFYTATFICCDIVSLSLQAAGGGLAATSNTEAGGQTGINIMIAGLAFQVASLTLFMILSADLIFAARRARPRAMDSSFAKLQGRIMFRLFPYAIGLATITIFIRCCYRVAELRNGFGGSLANNQTLFMIFEGPMIMVAALCLTVFHPGMAFGGVQGWRSANWTWKRHARSKQGRSEDGVVEGK